MSQFGTLRKFASKAETTVIHIQDVHANQEAQKNIAAALQALIRDNRADLIALEGAFAPIDLAAFRSFSDQDAIHLAADQLLAANDITGPIQGLLTLPADQALPPVVGVDDPVHYDANVQAVKDAEVRREQEKRALASDEEKLTQKKETVFNADLLAFDRLIEKFRKNQMELKDYAASLAQQSEALSPTVERFLEAVALEGRLNEKQVEQERAVLVSELVKRLSAGETGALTAKAAAFQAGLLSHAEFYGQLKTLCESKKLPFSRFPAMSDYLRYVLLSGSIDGEKLNDEFRALETRVYARVAVTNPEKELVKQSRRLYLTGKLIDFALTKQEWEEYRASHAPAAAGEAFERFYEEAEIRDERMAANLAMAAKKYNAKNIVLVTGGFHASGIRQNTPFSYVSFIPKISKLENASGIEYLSVFTQEKTPLEKLFEGEKLFLTRPPLSPIARIKEGVLGASISVRNGVSSVAGAAAWLQSAYGWTRVLIEKSKRGELSISGLTNGRFFRLQVNKGDVSVKRSYWQTISQSVRKAVHGFILSFRWDMKLSRDSDIPLLRCTRLLMGGAAFMSISFAYELTNIVNTFSGRGVHSTEWTTVDPLVPLMVVFTLPYLVFMTIPLMLAHFLRTWKQWDAYMRSAVFVLIPTFIFFLVFPTVMVRPALPGAGMRVFFLDMIYWIDRPYNSFPSLHAVMGTMTLFISYQLNKARSKWVALPLTAMVISTIFTKQHYVLDMVIGAVVGIWGAVLFKQALVRKQWARSKLRVPKIRPDIFLFAFVSAIIFDWSTKYYFTQVLGQAQRAEQTPYFLTKDVVKMPADVYSFWQNFAFDGWVLRLNHHALPLFSWGACLAFVAGMIIFLPVRSHVRAKVSWAGKGLFQGALLGATMANGLEVVSTGKATNWLWLKDFGTVNLADVIVYSAGTAYFFVLSFRAGAYFSRVLRKRGPPLINHLRSLIRTKTPGALYPLAKNLGVFKAGFIETYLYFGIYHFYFLAMPAWAALTLSFLFIMALHGYYGVSDGNGGKFETNTVGQQILVSFKASLVAVLGFVPYFAFSFVPVPNDHVTYVTGVLVTLGALLHGWKNRMAAKVWMVGPNRLVAESKNNARMRQVFFHMGLLFCAVLVANAFTQQGHINSYEMVGLLFAATAATVMVSLLARAIYKGRYPLKESVIMLVTMAGLGALTGFSTVLNPSESESVVKGPFEIKKGAFKEDIAIVLEKGLPFDRIVLQPQSEEPAGTKIYFDEGSPTAEFSFSSVKQTELHVIAKTDTSNTPVRFHLYSTLIRDGGNRKLASMVGTFLSIATGTVLWMWKFGRRKTKVLLADAPASDETVTEIKALLAGLGTNVSVVKRIGMGKNIDELKAVIALEKPAVVVVRSDTKAFKDADFVRFAAQNGVKVVLRAGAGVDNINVDAAQANGIDVQRTHGNANSVANLTLRFLLAGLEKKAGAPVEQNGPDLSLSNEFKEIFDMDPAQFKKALAKSVKAGRGDMSEAAFDEIIHAVSAERAKELFKQLEGKTIGLVGWGAIAQDVARKLNAIRTLTGVNFRIVATSPSLDGDGTEAVRNANAMGVLVPGKESVLRDSDVVSFHVPLTGKTKSSFEVEDFKKDGIVINTSRQEIFKPEFWTLPFDYYADVDHSDVTRALVSQHPEKAHIVPHVGASTADAAEGVEKNTLLTLRKIIAGLLGIKSVTDEEFEDVVFEELKKSDSHTVRSLLKRFGPRSEFKRNEEDLYRAIRQIGYKKRIKAGDNGEWTGFYPETDRVTGKPTGRIFSFQKIKKEGIVHASSYLILRSPSGRILVQQTNRGFWEWSAAGHVEVGQTPQAAAIAEANEELNLDQLGIHLTEDQLTRIRNVHGNHFWWRSERADYDGPPHYRDGVYELKGIWDWTQEQTHVFQAEISDEEMSRIHKFFQTKRTEEVQKVALLTPAGLADEFDHNPLMSIPPTSGIHEFMLGPVIRAHVFRELAHKPPLMASKWMAGARIMFGAHAAGMPGFDPISMAYVSDRLLVTREQIDGWLAKKVFTFDIDKTLADREASMTPEMMETLRELMRRGHLIVILTGSPMIEKRKRIFDALTMDENGRLPYAGNLIAITSEGSTIHHYDADGREYIVENEFSIQEMYTNEQFERAKTILDPVVATISDGVVDLPLTNRENTQMVVKVKGATSAVRAGYALAYQELLNKEFRNDGIQFKGMISGETTITLRPVMPKRPSLLARLLRYVPRRFLTVAGYRHALRAQFPGRVSSKAEGFRFLIHEFKRQGVQWNLRNAYFFGDAFDVEGNDRPVYDAPDLRNVTVVSVGKNPFAPPARSRTFRLGVGPAATLAFLNKFISENPAAVVMLTAVTAWGLGASFNSLMILTMVGAVVAGKQRGNPEPGRVEEFLDWMKGHLSTLVRPEKTVRFEIEFDAFKAYLYDAHVMEYLRKDVSHRAWITGILKQIHRNFLERVESDYTEDTLFFFSFFGDDSVPEYLLTELEAVMAGTRRSAGSDDDVKEMFAHAFKSMENHSPELQMDQALQKRIHDLLAARTAAVDEAERHRLDTLLNQYAAFFLIMDDAKFIPALASMTAAELPWWVRHQAVDTLTRLTGFSNAAKILKIGYDAANPPVIEAEAFRALNTRRGILDLELYGGLTILSLAVAWFFNVPLPWKNIMMLMMVAPLAMAFANGGQGNLFDSTGDEIQAIKSFLQEYLGLFRNRPAPRRPSRVPMTWEVTDRAHAAAMRENIEKILEERSQPGDFIHLGPLEYLPDSVLTSPKVKHVVVVGMGGRGTGLKHANAVRFGKISFIEIDPSIWLTQLRTAVQNSKSLYSLTKELPVLINAKNILAEVLRVPPEQLEYASIVNSAYLVDGLFQYAERVMMDEARKRYPNDGDKEDVSYFNDDLSRHFGKVHLDILSWLAEPKGTIHLVERYAGVNLIPHAEYPIIVRELKEKPFMFRFKKFDRDAARWERDHRPHMRRGAAVSPLVWAMAALGVGIAVWIGLISPMILMWATMLMPLAAVIKMSNGASVAKNKDINPTGEFFEWLQANYHDFLFSGEKFLNHFSVLKEFLADPSIVNKLRAYPSYRMWFSDFLEKLYLNHYRYLPSFYMESILRFLSFYGSDTTVDFLILELEASMMGVRRTRAVDLEDKKQMFARVLQSVEYHSPELGAFKKLAKRVDDLLDRRESPDQWDSERLGIPRPNAYDRHLILRVQHIIDSHLVQYADLFRHMEDAYFAPQLAEMTRADLPWWVRNQAFDAITRLPDFSRAGQLLRDNYYNPADVRPLRETLDRAIEEQVSAFDRQALIEMRDAIGPNQKRKATSSPSGFRMVTSSEYFSEVRVLLGTVSRINDVITDRFAAGDHPAGIYFEAMKILAEAGLHAQSRRLFEQSLKKWKSDAGDIYKVRGKLELLTGSKGLEKGVFNLDHAQIRSNPALVELLSDLLGFLPAKYTTIRISPFGIHFVFLQEDYLRAFKRSDHGFAREVENIPTEQLKQFIRIPSGGFYSPTYPSLVDGKSVVGLLTFAEVHTGPGVFRHETFHRVFNTYLFGGANYLSRLKPFKPVVDQWEKRLLDLGVQDPYLRFNLFSVAKEILVRFHDEALATVADGGIGYLRARLSGDNWFWGYLDYYFDQSVERIRTTFPNKNLYEEFTTDIALIAREILEQFSEILMLANPETLTAGKLDKKISMSLLGMWSGLSFPYRVSARRGASHLAVPLVLTLMVTVVLVSLGFVNLATVGRFAAYMSVPLVLGAAIASKSPDEPKSSFEEKLRSLPRSSPSLLLKRLVGTYRISVPENRTVWIRRMRLQLKRDGPAEIRVLNSGFNQVVHISYPNTQPAADEFFVWNDSTQQLQKIGSPKEIETSARELSAELRQATALIEKSDEDVDLLIQQSEIVVRVLREAQKLALVHRDTLMSTNVDYLQSQLSRWGLPLNARPMKTLQEQYRVLKESAYPAAILEELTESPFVLPMGRNDQLYLNRVKAYPIAIGKSPGKILVLRVFRRNGTYVLDISLTGSAPRLLRRLIWDSELREFRPSTLLSDQEEMTAGEIADDEKPLKKSPGVTASLEDVMEITGLANVREGRQLLNRLFENGLLTYGSGRFTHDEAVLIQATCAEMNRQYYYLGQIAHHILGHTDITPEALADGYKLYALLEQAISPTRNSTTYLMSSPWYKQNQLFSRTDALYMVLEDRLIRLIPKALLGKDVIHVMDIPKITNVKGLADRMFETRSGRRVWFRKGKKIWFKASAVLEWAMDVYNSDAPITDIHSVEYAVLKKQVSIFNKEGGPALAPYEAMPLLGLTSDQEGVFREEFAADNNVSAPLWIEKRGQVFYLETNLKRWFDRLNAEPQTGVSQPARSFSRPGKSLLYMMIAKGHEARYGKLLTVGTAMGKMGLHWPEVTRVLKAFPNENPPLWIERWGQIFFIESAVDRFVGRLLQAPVDETHPSAPLIKRIQNRAPRDASSQSWFGDPPYLNLLMDIISMLGVISGSELIKRIADQRISDKNTPTQKSALQSMSYVATELSQSPRKKRQQMLRAAQEAVTIAVGFYPGIILDLIHAAGYTSASNELTDKLRQALLKIAPKLGMKADDFVIRTFDRYGLVSNKLGFVHVPTKTLYFSLKTLADAVDQAFEGWRPLYSDAALLVTYGIERVILHELLHVAGFKEDDLMRLLLSPRETLPPLDQRPSINQIIDNARQRAAQKNIKPALDLFAKVAPTRASRRGAAVWEIPAVMASAVLMVLLAMPALAQLAVPFRHGQSVNSALNAERLEDEFWREIHASYLIVTEEASSRMTIAEMKQDVKNTLNAKWTEFLKTPEFNGLERSLLVQQGPDFFLSLSELKKRMNELRQGSNQDLLTKYQKQVLLLLARFTHWTLEYDVTMSEPYQAAMCQKTNCIGITHRLYWMLILAGFQRDREAGFAEVYVTANGFRQYIDNNIGHYLNAVRLANGEMMFPDMTLDPFNIDSPALKIRLQEGQQNAVMSTGEAKQRARLNGSQLQVLGKNKLASAYARQRGNALHETEPQIINDQDALRVFMRAFELSKEAYALDPLNPISSYILGYDEYLLAEYYFKIGKLDKADTLARSAVRHLEESKKNASFDYAPTRQYLSKASALVHEIQQQKKSDPKSIRRGALNWELYGGLTLLSLAVAWYFSVPLPWKTIAMVGVVMPMAVTLWPGWFPSSVRKQEEIVGLFVEHPEQVPAAWEWLKKNENDALRSALEQPQVVNKYQAISGRRNFFKQAAAAYVQLSNLGTNPATIKAVVRFFANRGWDPYLTFRSPLAAAILLERAESNAADGWHIYDDMAKRVVTNFDVRMLKSMEMPVRPYWTNKYPVTIRYPLSLEIQHRLGEHYAALAERVKNLKPFRLFTEQGFREAYGFAFESFSGDSRDYSEYTESRMRDVVTRLIAHDESILSEFELIGMKYVKSMYWPVIRKYLRPEFRVAQGKKKLLSELNADYSEKFKADATRYIENRLHSVPRDQEESVMTDLFDEFKDGRLRNEISYGQYGGWEYSPNKKEKTGASLFWRQNHKQFLQPSPMGHPMAKRFQVRRGVAAVEVIAILSVIGVFGMAILSIARLFRMSTVRKLKKSLTKQNLAADVQEITFGLRLPLATLRAIEAEFIEQQRLGNGADVAAKKSLNNFETFAIMPTGQEHGRYIAVNWGGTNVTVYLVDLKGDGEYKVVKKVENIKLSASHRKDPRSVFDLIAKNVKTLIDGDTAHDYKVGFVYGFPLEQKALNSGIAARWSKGFKDAKGRPVLGQDVAALLNKSLETAGLPRVRVSALMNDTLNPMIVKAYELYGKGERKLKVIAGSIVGTGTNSAALFDGVIGLRNLESGNFDFGGEKLLRRVWLEADRELDRDEKDPPSGKQVLEKMVSGKYLGEVVRRLAYEMMPFRALSGVSKPYSVTGEHLSMIENDKTPDRETIGKIFGKKTTLTERHAIQRVANEVVQRSAVINAVQFAAIVKEIDNGQNGRYVIAIEGSVAEKYPHYLDYVRDTLSSMGLNKPTGPSVNLMTVPNAQGVGAAILAATVGQAGPRLAADTQPELFPTDRTNGHQTYFSALSDSINNLLRGTAIKLGVGQKTATVRVNANNGLTAQINGAQFTFQNDAAGVQTLSDLLRTNAVKDVKLFVAYQAVSSFDNSPVDAYLLDEDANKRITLSSYVTLGDILRISRAMFGRLTTLSAQIQNAVLALKQA